MYRAVCKLVATAILTGATGCSMCASPYDYCGATFQGKGDPCFVVERAGSILAPAGDMAYTDQVVDDAVISNSTSNVESSEIIQDQASPIPAAEAPRLQPQPDSGADLRPVPGVHQARAQRSFRR